MVTNSKQYIAELGKNSLSLQKLNEQFRHTAPKPGIVSFYETRPASLGLKHMRVMILEKNSSVVGYPGEISKALDADHQGVCKYESPRDPNYVAVSNILRSLISKIISDSDRSYKQSLSTQEDSLNLKAMLTVKELPTIDYSFFRDQWAQVTSL
ncbi:Fc.00g108050.m01.CDS01 [Cosmosporella sp. VM-42]